jgi:hypothetical protein
MEKEKPILTVLMEMKENKGKSFQELYAEALMIRFADKLGLKVNK